MIVTEGKKAVSSATPTVTFHIHAADKMTAETVKEELAERAQDLIETVEIKEDSIKRLGHHVTKKINSLGTFDVTVETGMNVNCCQ